jgi:hypothetical protein
MGTEAKWQAERRKFERALNNSVRRFLLAVQARREEDAQSEAYQIYLIVEDLSNLAGGYEDGEHE